jgi:GT2 family glycosyltransferase
MRYQGQYPIFYAHKQSISFKILMTILAIILNWNELELTLRCIESLMAQKRCTCDILVIDNGSNQNPYGELRERFPEVMFIRNDRNLGVAGGRNIGLYYALKKIYSYILLFDNDAYAHDHMLYHLQTCMDNNKNCGIVGPKIYRDGQDDIIWRAGCLSWRGTYLYSFYSIFKKIYGILKKPLPIKLDIIRGDGHIDNGQFDEEKKVDFQIGCAQMIRVDLIRKIGVLDERFSPYGSEDIDFCERTKAAGGEIRYTPEAVCWHTIESAPDANPKRTFYNLKHILFLARKHLGKREMFFCFLPDFFLLHLPLVFVDSILQGNDCTKAVVQAVKWHLANIEEEGLFLR